MHLQSSKRFSVLLTLSLGVGEAPKRLSMPLWMTLLEVDTDLDLLFWLARERLDRLPPLLPRLSKSSRCHLGTWSSSSSILLETRRRTGLLDRHVCGGVPSARLRGREG